MLRIDLFGTPDGEPESKFVFIAYALVQGIGLGLVFHLAIMIIVIMLSLIYICCMVWSRHRSREMLREAE